MTIEKIINDNLICVLNSEQKMLLVSGEGIGQGVNVGDDFLLSNVKEMYTLANTQLGDELISVLSDVPGEYISVAREVVAMAEENLGEELKEVIYIGLLEYFYIAAFRLRHGSYTSVRKNWMLRKFYVAEYEIAEKTIQIARDRLKIPFPDDAIDGLALLFIQSQGNSTKERAVEITILIERILKLIDYYFGTELEKNETELELFMKHLKAFAHRIFTNEMLPEKDVAFQDSIQRDFPSYYHCSEMISRMILDEFDRKLTREEVIYLTIHIGRMMGEE